MFLEPGKIFMGELVECDDDNQTRMCGDPCRCGGHYDSSQGAYEGKRKNACKNFHGVPIL